jgi:Tfp pilus assembly protein PilN
MTDVDEVSTVLPSPCKLSLFLLLLLLLLLLLQVTSCVSGRLRRCWKQAGCRHPQAQHTKTGLQALSACQEAARAAEQQQAAAAAQQAVRHRASQQHTGGLAGWGVGPRKLAM